MPEWLIVVMVLIVCYLAFFAGRQKDAGMSNGVLDRGSERSGQLGEQVAKRPNEGIRRLSLVLGLVIAVPWFVIVGLMIMYDPPMGTLKIATWLAGTGLAFLVGWGGVRVIAWIVDGFRRG